MTWEILLDKDVQAFILEHEGDDVAALALKKPPNKDWPYPVILDQIKVRQKARLKTPKLRDTKGFVFPSHFLYEQVSSESCAAYKAQITRGLGGCFVDLTAGAGVDSFALAKNFTRGTLVEKNNRNASIILHNASRVGKGCGDSVCGEEGENSGDSEERKDNTEILIGESPKLDIKNMCAEEYVRELLVAGEKVSLVYIDPQRREGVGGGRRKAIFDFELCSPNILELLPDLAKISNVVLIKAAPFLDIDKAVKQLGSVQNPRIDVYVVQWRGDCREVLYMLDFCSPEYDNGALINAVDLDDYGNVQNSISFHMNDEYNAQVCYAMPEVGEYICEPDPAFLKAGCFKYISQYFCMCKLHAHTHLYVCKKKREDFTGKIYKIIGIFPVKSRVLPVGAADIAVRNFPQSVAALRNKLGLRDGGKYRVYATTTYDNKHRLILCEKG